MTNKQMKGAKNNSTKRLYIAPELQVDKTDKNIIFTSSYGYDGEGDMSDMGNIEI